MFAFMRKYIDLQKTKAKKRNHKVKIAGFIRKTVRKPIVKKTAAVVGIFALVISSVGAFPLTASAASAGPNSADVVGNDSTIGTESWDDTSEAKTSDNDRSDAGLSDNEISRYLKATDFDFAIPGDALINGIIVEVEKQAQDEDRIKDNSVKLVKGGVIGGDNKATSSFWGESDFYETYGSATELWGLTWTASDINASNFGVVFAAKKDTSAGGTVQARVDHIRITVYFTEPQPGILHVIKVVDNTGGGVATADQFTIDVAGGNASPSQFAGSALGTDVTIDAGAAYTVTEQDPGADYAVDYSEDCSGVMSDGGDMTCTVTNTFVPPPPPEKAIIIITKIVSNDNGGGAGIGSFDLFIDATKVSSGDQTEFDPGSYVISESGGPDGYASSIGGDCDENGNLTVEADGIYQCVITNDDIAPSLTLVKEVNGGDASAADWTLTATGDQYVPAILSGNGNAGSDGNFQAGTYTLSESAGPDNYVAGSWSCEGDAENTGDQITLNVGQSATCTITNTFVPPQELEETLGSITICKIIIDQDGNITDGFEQADVTFTIPWLTPDPETSQGAPVAQIDPDATFTTTLDLNTQIFGTSQGNDAECVVYTDLALGGYFYGEEQISGGTWENPMYNDQFQTALTTLADFFIYDGNLFDGNPADDDSRNLDADGHIVLNEDRPDRTLVVLNQFGAEQTFTLTVEIIGDGEGSVHSDDGLINCDSTNLEESDCQETYNAGEEVEITATPKEGSSFEDTWFNACTGNNPLCVLTMNSNQHAQAHFSVSNGGGNGGNGGGPVTTSGSTSGGSSGGGGGGGVANPNLNTPAPQVAGTQTPPPAPQVAGETLPRTGMDLTAIGLLIALVGLGTLMPRNGKTKKLKN